MAAGTIPHTKMEASRGPLRGHRSLHGDQSSLERSSKIGRWDDSAYENGSLPWSASRPPCNAQCTPSLLNGASKTGRWGDSAYENGSLRGPWLRHRALLRETCCLMPCWRKVCPVGILVKDRFRSKNSFKNRAFCEELPIHAKTGRWGDSAYEIGSIRELPIATERGSQLIYINRENSPLGRFRIRKWKPWVLHREILRRKNFIFKGTSRSHTIHRNDFARRPPKST